MHPTLRKAVDDDRERWLEQRNRMFDRRFKDVFGFFPDTDTSDGYTFVAYGESWGIENDDLVRYGNTRRIIRTPRDFAHAYDEG